MSEWTRKPCVYLCEGCGIKDALDMDALEQVASMELGLSETRRAEAFCEGPGLETLKKDMQSGDVNQAIIVACSPRVMAETFRELPGQVIRANIREQVIWTQPPNDEDTQMMASDNLRMAAAEASKSAPPEAYWDSASSLKLLVVGGGVTGLTAAREAARAGCDVVLVEKADQLGGWAAKWSKTIPHQAPYTGLQDNPVDELIKQVEADKAITVRTSTIVGETSGEPGKFTVQLKNGKGDDWDVFGSIIVATGWREWDTSRLEYLGYGKSDRIITDVQFEERLASGDVPETAAIIITHDKDIQPYSSGVSSKVAIKQALQIMRANPDAMVYVIYEELRAHGTAESFYREAQQAGVIFQKGEVKSVDADLTVTVHDDLLGEDIPMTGLDLVVLTTGMVPNSTNPDIEATERGADLLKDDIRPNLPVITINGELPDAPDSGKMPELPGGPVLNLQYRQGPHLPVLANGFADSHYICFPYETRRTGIYTCGPVRRPMTIAEAAQDAQGAVLKAIQAMRAANQAVSVHPRVGDLSYPEFGLNICTKCRRCTVECPFGAIDEDPETDYPVLNPSRCRRCGTCMGACPVSTITFKNYNPQMVSDMIGAIEMPDEFDEKPRILVLACENDAYPALDMAGINRREINKYMRFIPVRCLGSVTLLWIKTALEKGYDGIMLMGCKSGDDYQCHFVKGSAMAKERMSKVGETLQSMMMEEERVQVAEISIADSKKIADTLNTFGKQIEDLGLNPFKM